MHIGNYLNLLDNSEQQLAEAFDQVADHHQDEPDIQQICHRLAGWSRDNQAAMRPFVDRYAEQKSEEPDRLMQELFAEPRSGSLALLRDLHDLWLLASQVHLSRTVISQGALALHDKELEATCTRLNTQTKRQLDWLIGRIKQAAPQTLVAAA